MSEEQFGTADDYFSAFMTLQKEGIPEKHIALLQAHFKAPNHTATWAQLAEAVGYANRNAVNLQYGMLASRVARLLGFVEPPRGFWLNVLAGWAENTDPSGHTAFVLRRPVIEALTRLGIFEGEKTLNYWVVRGSPAHNGDFDFIKPGRIGKWRTKRPPSDWKIGDRIFFWASSPRLELIALGEFRGKTGEYTEDDEVRYSVCYLTPVVTRPLCLAELRADSALRDAIFLKKGPATSVVRLSQNEGQHLYRLLVSENTTISGTWPELENDEAFLPDVDDFAIEGGRRLVQHFRLERSKSLVDAKKKSTLTLTGSLACEVCGFDFKTHYGDLGEGFCEVHHWRPLATFDRPSITRLEDLAIVCSNCHRILHRANCELSVEELRQRMDAAQHWKMK